MIEIKESFVEEDSDNYNSRRTSKIKKKANLKKSLLKRKKTSKFNILSLSDSFNLEGLQNLVNDAESGI
jgi:hypothetical protein